MSVNIKQILAEMQGYSINYKSSALNATESVANMSKGADSKILVVTVVGHLIVIDSEDVTTFRLKDNNHTILDAATYSIEDMMAGLKSPKYAWEYNTTKAVTNISSRVFTYTLGKARDASTALCRDLCRTARASSNANDFATSAYEVCNRYNQLYPNLLNEQMIESIASSGQQPPESFVRACMAVKVVAEHSGIMCIESAINKFNRLFN